MTTILISGASSGIGAALAQVYAQPGNCLILWGRDEARLNATAAEVRARGASVVSACFDLNDLAALLNALAAAEQHAVVDIAIFNAGLGGSLSPDAVAQDVHHAVRMATVNFTAPVTGANFMADRMAKRKSGKIVLVSSIAAQFPLPMAPVYSGSKAGLTMFAEALGLRLKRHGVQVSVVAPGFIDTPMSQGLSEPRPFLIGPKKAAAVIARKIARGARMVVVPWQFAVIAVVSRFIPRWIVRRVLSSV